jgi:hypothetical protein
MRFGWKAVAFAPLAAMCLGGASYATARAVNGAGRASAGSAATVADRNASCGLDAAHGRIKHLIYL